MLTIIGDVHGKYDQYVQIARKREATLQIGDMGFKFSHMNALDPNCHKLFGGNHDNYSLIGSCPHNLGNFGQVTLGGIEFFFVRGGISIDRHMRTENISWWRDEELTYKEAAEAMQMYRECKPKLMITHQPPELVVPLMGFDKIYPSITGKLFDRMFELHQPEFWIFGHMHKSWNQNVQGTEFHCLNELETYFIG
jgi:predicted phosphodiesterase